MRTNINKKGLLDIFAQSVVIFGACIREFFLCCTILQGNFVFFLVNWMLTVDQTYAMCLIKTPIFHLPTISGISIIQMCRGDT